MVSISIQASVLREVMKLAKSRQKSKRSHIIFYDKYPGGGGGGGTLIISYIRRLRSFWGVQNFEIQYFLGGLKKNEYFWGMKILRIFFWGVITKLDYI